jgi:hypothetical protein
MVYSERQDLLGREEQSRSERTEEEVTIARRHYDQIRTATEDTRGSESISIILYRRVHIVTVVKQRWLRTRLLVCNSY